jgi:hypothetical protein
MSRRLVVAACAIPFALATIACGMGDKDVAGPGAGQPASGGAAKHTIVFDVAGPAEGADITYGVGADQSQDNGAKLPWRKETGSNETLIITALVAQSKGTAEITCTITVDGKVKKTNKSSGQFAVVSCSA